MASLAFPLESHRNVALLILVMHGLHANYETVTLDALPYVQPPRPVQNALYGHASFCTSATMSPNNRFRRLLTRLRGKRRATFPIESSSPDAAQLDAPVPSSATSPPPQGPHTDPLPLPQHTPFTPQQPVKGLPAVASNRFLAPPSVARHRGTASDDDASPSGASSDFPYTPSSANNGTSADESPLANRRHARFYGTHLLPRRLFEVKTRARDHAKAPSLDEQTNSCISQDLGGVATSPQASPHVHQPSPMSQVNASRLKPVAEHVAKNEAAVQTDSADAIVNATSPRVTLGE